MAASSVVDEEPHIGRVLSAIIGSCGDEVTMAPGGNQGLNEMRTADVDLVILGPMMRDTNELEILSTIPADPRPADTRVILLTAQGQDRDRKPALAGGANDFLTKPFSPKRLIARIEEILGRD